MTNLTHRGRPGRANHWNRHVGWESLTFLPLFKQVFITMSSNSAQDVILCNVCTTSAAQVNCENCQVKLCSACLCNHFSNASNKDSHIMSLLKPRGPTPFYPKCQTHSDLALDCKCHCQDCDTPVCESCVSSTVHKGHKIVDMKTALQNKKEVLQRDLQELETNIYPAYQKIASTLSEIPKSITDLKALMDSKDIRIVSTYKSRNDEFRKLLLDKFSPQKFNGNIQNDHQNGPPSASSFALEEPVTPRRTTGAEPSPTKRPQLDEASFTTVCNTGYKDLHSVACVDDEKIWTSGLNKTMKLFNLRGNHEKSMDTTSGVAPLDITVTKCGDLVYVDYRKGTVNIIKGTPTSDQVIIRRNKWKPRNVCTTSSGDFLVVMVSDDDYKSQIVRFSDSKEKQIIQFGDTGKPLFSSTISSKYISENRNLDICVSDSEANAVVVLTQAGKLRFRYPVSTSATKKEFKPIGITTDSQSRILASDLNNRKIHILDQDGQFLGSIDNCQLETPWGLCVDSRDNLFVAEYNTGDVKKIQYYKQTN
eukprot:XP_011456127.1 PREDICTED: uncharacterized protein LOC105348425 isoform X1 [Crassostrea gigas]